MTRERNDRRQGVLQVVLSLAPGGTERLVIDLCVRLAGRFRMAVCCLDEAGAWAPELAPHGVEVVTLGRRAGFRPGLGGRVSALARRSDARILHCHQYSPFVYGCLARIQHPALRLVFTEHGRLSDAPPVRKRRLANRALWRLAHEICAVSDNLRHHMIAEGFPPQHVHVVYNGIDPGELAAVERRQYVRRAFGIPDDAFVVGTIARLDPVKDLPTLCEGFRELRDAARDAWLLIVGDGPAREDLIGCVERAGLQAAVRLAGYRANARELLAGVDAYVNSSLHEGISLTILEAMAAGLPVVATRVGGTSEVVLDRDTGILVPPGAPAALAAALAELRARPDACRRFGSAGRARVLERFTIDRMVERYASLYTGGTTN